MLFINHNNLVHNNLYTYEPTKDGKQKEEGEKYEGGGR